MYTVYPILYFVKRNKIRASLFIQAIQVLCSLSTFFVSKSSFQCERYSFFNAVLRNGLFQTTFLLFMCRSSPHYSVDFSHASVICNINWHKFLLFKPKTDLTYRTCYSKLKRTVYTCYLKTNRKSLPLSVWPSYLNFCILPARIFFQQFPKTFDSPTCRFIYFVRNYLLTVDQASVTRDTPARFACHLYYCVAKLKALIGLLIG